MLQVPINNVYFFLFTSYCMALYDITANVRVAATRYRGTGGGHSRLTNADCHHSPLRCFSPIYPSIIYEVSYVFCFIIVRKSS